MTIALESRLHRDTGNGPSPPSIRRNNATGVRGFATPSGHGNRIQGIRWWLKVVCDRLSRWKAIVEIFLNRYWSCDSFLNEYQVNWYYNWSQWMQIKNFVILINDKIYNVPENVSTSFKLLFQSLYNFPRCSAYIISANSTIYGRP